jgi:hypothetical protein
MKILYIQQDYLNSKELKKWDFSRHLGIAYSLRLSGAEVQTIMIPHLNKFKNALKNSTYDVCVVNDVIHGLCMDSPNLKSLTQDDVLYLKSKSKIMLGFVNEQLSSYLDEQSQSNDLAKEQISKFEKVQNLFDCFAVLGYESNQRTRM